LSAALALAGLVVGAITGTILQSVVWPEVQAPSWLRVSHEGIGNSGTGLGVLAGFMVAVLVIAWHRKRSGFKALNQYPPVKRLKEYGWHEDTS
jgi:hypothetical protein